MGIGLAAALATTSLAFPVCAQDIKLGFAGALSGPAAFVGVEIARRRDCD